MIDVEGLTRYYGEKRAISDVSFHVKEGEILGMLGPNAAGKTTTMRILTCFMPPTSGKATIGGYDIFEHSMDVRRITGYLPENPPLYTDMSVTDYLDFVAKLKGIDKTKRKTEVDSVVEKAALGDVQTRIIGKLSKGYKQRVGLAQSLLNNPKIVILDEPTVGLDPKQIIEIRELIKNLRGEHTVILSSHILPEIEQTCERVVIINDGRVVAEDTPENLMLRLKGGERTQLQIEGKETDVKKALNSIKEIKSFETTADDKGIVNVVVESEKDIRKMLAKNIVGEGLGLLELSTDRFTLEDIFLHLTTKEEEVA
ncbi:MAG TPA: ATP-binding cassette domain-containing protein [Caldithrix sp.]|nr:ATP-binding cassette domain-containing protein [Calditrichaceae bacterium]HEM49233.1 ATP-binding cassette domain-containing protein [Caldithrix sp.]HES58796.1 ATP-binding cassette domain-containing protein [Caldithrix sp.]